jgi:hypothetical protein
MTNYESIQQINSSITSYDILWWYDTNKVIQLVLFWALRTFSPEHCVALVAGSPVSMSVSILNNELD